MRIETWKVGDINPAPYNPRVTLHPGDTEYESLRRSIERFNLVQPLVVNERTGNLIGGHQRLQVLKATGTAEVQVSIVDLEPAEEKALNIALNKISGRWDNDKLADLLSELGDLESDPDLWTVTGFSQKELTKVLDDANQDSDDTLPLPPESNPVTTKGNVWVLGDHRLMCGDCTEKDDVDALMQSDLADSVVTDPPYGVDYASKNEFLNKIACGNRIQTPIINDSIADYRQFFRSFLELAKVGQCNTFYVFSFGHRLHELRLAAEDAGITWGDYLLWVKNQQILSRKDYNPKHEFIFYGWRGKHKFYGGHCRTTILEFPKPQKSTLHPTMKPIPLVEQLITDGSPHGGLIYDAFGGSGSTLIACANTDRRCRTMELSPSYCDVIIKRWQEHTGENATLQSTGQTFDSMVMTVEV